MNNRTKIKIGFMSSVMDDRNAKGTAIAARKLVERLAAISDADLSLIHYEKSSGDSLYQKVNEIIIPLLKLPFASHFFSQILFFLRTKERFDIIHWFQPRLYPFYWLAPAKRIVVTAHGGGDVTAPGLMTFSRRVFNFIFTHFCRWVDIVIVDSEFAKEETAKAYKMNKNKIRVVYLGVDDKFAEWRSKASDYLSAIGKYGLSPGYLLTVGRIQPHKNIKRVAEAYIKMRENTRFDNRLVIVGKPYFDYEPIFRLAKTSSFKNDIIFIDFVDDNDLPAIYGAAALFLFPSLNEGFGMPVLEAMASGVPVITSNTTALPEVAGNAALLINPENVEEIREAMEKVLADETLRKTLVQDGIIRAAKFTWEKTAAATAMIYKEVLQSD